MMKQLLSKLTCMILFFAPATALPQTSQDVLDALRKVGETYRAMKTYQAGGVVAMEMRGQGMQYKMEVPVTITIAAKGKMRAETKGSAAAMLMVSDGETLWMYMPQLNKYSKINLGTRSDQKTPLSAMAASFSPFGGQYSSIAENVKQGKLLRDDSVQVDGLDVLCHVFDVEYEPGAVNTNAAVKSLPMKVESTRKTYWIDRARNLVLREDSTMTMKMPNAENETETKQTMTWNKVTVDGPVSDDLFVFTPPAGATEMDLTQFLPTGTARPK